MSLTVLINNYNIIIFRQFYKKQQNGLPWMDEGASSVRITPMKRNIAEQLYVLCYYTTSLTYLAAFL